MRKAVRVRVRAAVDVISRFFMKQVNNMSELLEIRIHL